MSYSVAPTARESATLMNCVEENNDIRRKVKKVCAGPVALKQESEPAAKILDFVDEVTTDGRLIFEQSNDCLEALLTLLGNVKEVKEDGEIIIEGFEDFRKDHLIIETVEGDVSIYKRDLPQTAILDYLTEVSADGKLNFLKSNEYTTAIFELLENVIEVKEDGEIIFEGFECFSKHYKVMLNEHATETIYLRSMI